MVWLSSLLAAFVLAAIHLWAGKLRFLDRVPRSRWLSIAGGVAIAYTVVHLLPELSEHQVNFSESATGDIVGGDRIVWLLCLIGLTVFYGMEKLALNRHRRRDEDARGKPDAVFWLHIALYALYNTLIGYLLVREDRGLATTAAFTAGIGLHFVVNDYGLQQHYREGYRRIGRLVLCGAILLGWAIGIATALHEWVTLSVIAFLAGAIILNTFKEELPEERESRFGAFAGGAACYAVILLFL